MPLINATPLTESDRVGMCAGLIRCGYQVSMRKVRVEGEKTFRHLIEYTLPASLKKEEDPNNA